MTIPIPSQIVASRLERLNAQLIQATGALTDIEASTWPTATAPSCKWHLWHMGRWADYVQALLSPVVDSQSPELWEFAGIADEWGFTGIDLGLWGAGSGLGNENGKSLPLPDTTRVTTYAREAFALLEQRVARIDASAFDSAFTDWHGNDTSVGDALIGYIAHANRHLGMIEAISGVLGKNGTVTI